MEMKPIMNRSLSQKENVIYIPVKSIKPNPYQPRRNCSTGGLRELSDSIRQYGVIQPITVRQRGFLSYELIAGERRLRASQMAGIEKIPALVIDAGENDSAIISLIENIQREDLSFFDEAEALKSLIDTHNISQEILARKLGKSQPSIANKLRLLRLDLKERSMIVEYNLSERHARCLIRIADRQKRMEILKKICDANLNVRDTEKLVDKTVYEKEKRDRKDKKIKIFTDIRVFTNTILHAVSSMKESGIDAESTKFENDDYYEYVIKIKKKKDAESPVDKQATV